MQEAKKKGALMLAALAISGCVAYGVNALGAAQTESVYAQGEYVQALEGVSSPFADVARTVMP